MSAIGPGDWVECVDASPHHHRPDIVALLTAGRLYCIRAVMDYSGRTGVLLCGIKNPVHPSGLEWGYVPERFRPIYRPRAEFLESLLTPADAPSEREGVDA